ncbi:MULTISPECIES: hypothetical protein [unclassified Leucobacter]|uniref:hypothetical protein n=1 Tax=unclassified Leucobacter TaxID=2621730 RepID=UPI00062114C0|nr:hypothetical protein [Leucobacter sp. Ag1]KKI16404.1 hypothetical protein XM48_16585 [Leucobacter sp. Ag1]
MDLIIPIFVGFVSFAAGGVLVLHANRRDRISTARLAEATAARAEASSILAEAETIAQEALTSEMLVLLDRLDMPTPGCKCEVCVARRAAASGK